ncbi:hypothetical protein BTA35_0212670 [Oceanospirillum linum]|uniref:RNA polymerase subunit sigma-70 n=1 Tax=Oceanospirillum linum TaxID=966 RepID=A0A1T1HAI1_OCELI|nr:hypothetical protein BTA35_0212670 [Oceanospirillum linum]
MSEIWLQYEAELLAFLQSKLNNYDEAEDLLQELFFRLMDQKKDLWEIKNTRAWLFRVARNKVIDAYRSRSKINGLQKITTTEDIDALPEKKQQPEEPVAQLDRCLLRNLEELPPADAQIIEQCDLNGMKQAEFARQNNLTLPAAKARLLRARKKLRAAIIKNCQVQFDTSGKVCGHIPR